MYFYFSYTVGLVFGQKFYRCLTCRISQRSVKRKFSISLVQYEKVPLILLKLFNTAFLRFSVRSLAEFFQLSYWIEIDSNFLDKVLILSNNIYYILQFLFNTFIVVYYIRVPILYNIYTNKTKFVFW